MKQSFEKASLNPFDRQACGGILRYGMNLLSTALLLSLMLAGRVARGQDLSFTEVEPVVVSALVLERFPALQDMRSAWGDYNGDGKLDVVIMGALPTGQNGAGPTIPVTRLYLNVGFPQSPFRFIEVNAALPQLQDGAMAWGDLDNDGDLDLAMTGSLSATPATADLRVFVLRNNGPGAPALFTSIPLDASFTGSRWGSLSWGDIDNDGDVDLFVSGDVNASSVIGVDRIQFSRIHENDRGILRAPVQRFLGPRGVNAEWDANNGIPGAAGPSPYDGSLTRRATWVDVNKDSFLDLILTTDDDMARIYGQPGVGPNFDSAGAWRAEVWLNEYGSPENGPFERLGHSIGGNGVNLASLLGWDPRIENSEVDLWDHVDIQGGVADWNGDGLVDIASLNESALYIDVRDPTGTRPSSTDRYGNYNINNLRQYAGMPSADDFIPNFDWVSGATMLPAAAQVSADLINSGVQQWLGSVFELDGSDLGPPIIKLLVNGGESLGPAGFAFYGIDGRFRGVLDAVDVDGDGRLDVLHSGFEEALTLGTQLYKNNDSLANTPPSAPQGLVAEVTALYVKFGWEAATDARTPSVALRYAVSLRNDAGRYYIQPGATAAGVRLTPGLDGTLGTTHFFFIPAGNDWLPDGTYYWTVQAIDSGGMGSAFAPEQSFTLRLGRVIDSEAARLPYRDVAIDPGDVENDGNLDLVLAGRSETVSSPAADSTVVNVNRSGWFDPNTELPPLENGSVRWGDVDGDGDLDLAMSGKSSGQPMTRIYQNNSGILGLRNVLEGAERSALDWADFDNDGDLDLIVTGYRNGSPRTRLYRNGGDDNDPPNKLDLQPTTLTDVGAGAVAWGDYDGDGDLDLLLCGDTQTYNGALAPCVAPPYHLRPPNASYMCGITTGPPPRSMTTLFRNDGLDTSIGSTGQWRFTPVVTELPPIFSFEGREAMTARAEWCDLNGDGYPDLVLGGMFGVAGHPDYATPAAKIFRNAGPGPGLGEWKFLTGPQLLTDVITRALDTLTCADWDNDGLPDLLLSGRINDAGNVPTHIIHNEGMAFSRPSYLCSLDEGALQFASGLAAFGQFDEDADIDVVLSGMWGLRSISGNSDWGTVGNLFLNETPTTNGPPSAPAGLAASVTDVGTVITLSWLPSTDDHTPTPGLTYNLLVERNDGRAGGMPGMADRATGVRRVSRVGNVGSHTTWVLRNLPAGEYRWSVQAIDAALAPSAFTHAAGTFTAGPPRRPVFTPLPPLHNWIVGNPPIVVVDLLGVAAGRNARIAVGRRGRIVLSRNRDLFAEVKSGVFTDLHDAIIDPEGTTVVGEAGVILTSQDGIIWDQSPSGVPATLRAVARGGTGWVAAGDDVILHSTDRLSWTPGTMPAGTIVHDLAWAFGRYVAVGELAGNGLLLASTDGVSWTDVTPPSLVGGRLTGVATDGFMFAAVGGKSGFPGGFADILYSLNGFSWNLTRAADVTPLQRIIHSADGWFAVHEYSVSRSQDALTWTFVDAEGGFIPPKFTAVAADDGLITVSGLAGALFDSPVTPAFLRRRSGNNINTYSYEPEALAALGSTVVAVGQMGLQHVSHDGGYTWQGRAFIAGDAFYGVAAGNGRLVRSHYRGFDWSADGFTWETVAASSPRSIVFGGGRFVAASWFGGFFVSSTGVTWNEVSTSTPACIALAYGNGQFMALDELGNVYVSFDGSSWGSVGFVNARRLSFAHDRFFAMSASGLDVRSSVDGVTWQPVAGIPFGATISQVIRHRDRYIAVGGPNALLLSSPDAVTWTPAPATSSGTLNVALSTAEGLIIAGTGQALLLSPDPIPLTTPVAVPDSLERLPDRPIKVLAAKLIANDSDPNGDPLTLTAVSSTTANGAIVEIDGPWVVYSPPSGFNDTDSFTYTVSDGNGGEDTATVTVTVDAGGNAPTQNITAVQPQPGGSLRLRFVGVPGRIYVIEATENLAMPWVELAEVQAGPNGAYEYEDLEAANYPTRFYRSVRP